MALRALRAVRAQASRASISAWTERPNSVMSVRPVGFRIDRAWSTVRSLRPNSFRIAAIILFFSMALESYFRSMSRSLPSSGPYKPAAEFRHVVVAHGNQVAARRR